VAFQDDSAKKRRKATEKVLEAANNWVDPVYQKLEAARLAGESLHKLT
jgi:hypothetical protein